MKTINLSNKTLAECTVTLKEVLLSSDNNEVNITGINKEKYEYLVISFNSYVRSNLARCKSYINNNFCFYIVYIFNYLCTLFGMGDKMGYNIICRWSSRKIFYCIINPANTFVYLGAKIY